VRESLFARIGDLDGAAVLDLYAGTGALGIEALSRGAASAAFVERAARSLSVLRANLKALGLVGRARVLPGDVCRVVRRLGKAGERFDLILMDPPYASAELPRALEALVGWQVLAPGATVVVESGWCHSLPAAEGLTRLDERRYGDTRVTRLVAADEVAARGGPDEA
jgi:16S rRNA (guanine966-N2)-methyltransferase